MTDEHRPDPPITSEVDISGLDGFMLNVQRLFASELWVLSSGDEFKAAIALWGRAWQQKPPGSLPNDERVLAAFSGAGNGWRKVRAMALRGFVECSDGRLYHRVLCEDVINAHRKRQAFRERTKNATEARRQRHEQRDGQRDGQRNDGGDDDVDDVHDDQRNVVAKPNVASVQGQGQGQEAFSLRSKAAGVDHPAIADPPSRRPTRARRSVKPGFPTAEFERWYDGYPHKVDRHAAERAFERVFNSGEASLEQLIAGRDAYIASKPADRPWCNPATWLNGKRWLDRPADAKTGGNAAPDLSSEPRVDLGGGIQAPHSTIRSVWSRGRWLPDWGPKPDEPGCRVPPETMARIMEHAA